MQFSISLEDGLELMKHLRKGKGPFAARLLETLEAQHERHMRTQSNIKLFKGKIKTFSDIREHALKASEKSSNVSKK